MNEQGQEVVAQQGTQATPLKIFDPARPAFTYTKAQWDIKKDWYATKLLEIAPLENPTPAQSQAMLKKLDEVATVAYIDAATLISNYENYKQALDVEERRLHASVQDGQQTVGKKDPQKLTVADIDSLVTEVLATKPYNGGKLTLYEIISESRERANFMKNVKAAIDMKMSEFITTSANIKSEIQLNGMTPNVPN